MDKKALRNLIIASIIIVVISPLGIMTLGGAYWLLYFPFAFGSLIFLKQDRDYLELIRNLQFFVFILPSFLLLRFYQPIANYLGLNNEGIMWYFLVLLTVQGLTLINCWRVLDLALGPLLAANKYIAINISGAYMAATLGPSVVLLVFVLPGEKMASLESFRYLMVNAPYLVSFSVTFYVLLSFISLLKQRPESVLLSHRIKPQIIDIHYFLLKKGFYPVLLLLSLITEFFFRDRNFGLLLAALLPITAYLLYFSYLARLGLKYRGKKTELKEDKTQLGLIFGILSPFVMGPIIFVLYVIDHYLKAFK